MKTGERSAVARVSGSRGQGQAEHRGFYSRETVLDAMVEVGLLNIQHRE